MSIHAFLSAAGGEPLKDYLREHDCLLTELEPTACVYQAVASHADMFLCRLEDSLVAEPQLYDHLSQTGQCCEAVPSKRNNPMESGLMPDGLSLVRGSLSLGFSYPEDIRYNAVQIGPYFIHNTDHTDPLLLQIAENAGLRIIKVKQGYTRCSVVPVGSTGLITADRGIASALKCAEDCALDVLTIHPGSVLLPGLSSGFLGGASGRLGEELLFNGDLSTHPDFNRIVRFIEDHGLKARWFESYPLTDIGSIITTERNSHEKTCDHSHLSSS